jgi:hypothetical protein
MSRLLPLLVVLAFAIAMAVLVAQSSAAILD